MRAATLFMALAIPAAALGLAACSKENGNRFEGSVYGDDVRRRPLSMPPRNAPLPTPATCPDPANPYAEIVTFKKVEGVRYTGEGICAVYREGASEISYVVGGMTAETCNREGLAKQKISLKLKPGCTAP